MGLRRQVHAVNRGAPRPGQQVGVQKPHAGQVFQHRLQLGGDAGTAVKLGLVDENRQMYVRNFFISSELEINELFLLTGQQESRYKQNIVERPTDCLITENAFFLYLQAELFLALEPLYHQ